jgi:adenosine deaminase
VQWDGIRAGIAAARTDLGLTALFSPGINRELGLAAAEDYLDACLALRCDERAGIGLDGNEAPHPPEPFAAVLARARAAGLTVTIQSDDPTMFGTTLAQEYLVAHRDLGFTAADIRASRLAGLAACWPAAADRDRMARDRAAEIDAAIDAVLA